MAARAGNNTTPHKELLHMLDQTGMLHDFLALDWRGGPDNTMVAFSTSKTFDKPFRGLLEAEVTISRLAEVGFIAPQKKPIIHDGPDGQWIALPKADFDKIKAAKEAMLAGGIPTEADASLTVEDAAARPINPPAKKKAKA